MSVARRLDRRLGCTGRLSPASSATRGGGELPPSTCRSCYLLPGADSGVGAGAGAHPWGGVSPFKIHYSIAFKHQSITGRPPLGEILYPPLTALSPPLGSDDPLCSSPSPDPDQIKPEAGRRKLATIGFLIIPIVFKKNIPKYWSCGYIGSHNIVSRTVGA